MSEPRLVEVRRNVLKQNDVIARDLREQFRNAGVFVVSLVSSPGSGKTTFLEKTLTQLQPQYRVAALVGDLATENDAVRLARSKAPVKQITTGTLCHLEAAMVESALKEWDVGQLDFLFIENVGNLVCPSAYDLGEDLRLVLLSVTEGEDKPLKYPHMFRAAAVVVLTKTDLLPHVGFDVGECLANVRRVNPAARVFQLSVRNGSGVPELCDWMASQTRVARA